MAFCIIRIIHGVCGQLCGGPPRTIKRHTVIQQGPDMHPTRTWNGDTSAPKQDCRGGQQPYLRSGIPTSLSSNQFDCAARSE